MMRAWFGGAVVAVCLAFSAAPAGADLVVKVNLEDQQLDVFVHGRHRHSWSISSGRRGYETPTGTFRPQRLEREWYSRQYDDAPMPHSIFYSGGYAIHGTYATRQLGRTASHGCIRLSPGNAARLYALVEQHGRGRTRIEIED